MIISHKYRYVFVGVPHTACTAIAKELCDLYDGAQILKKHSTYHEFLDVATKAERQYFAFGTMRNPLDEATSNYFKLKSDHKGVYSKADKGIGARGRVGESELRWFRFLRETGADFETYFMKRMRGPHCNPHSWSFADLDYLIRYESLQEDFAEVLNRLSINQIRPIPLVNKTGGKGNGFIDAFTPKTHDRAKYVFGPYMKKWRYDFPSEWRPRSVPLLAHVEFFVIDNVGRLCSKYLRGRTKRRLLSFGRRTFNIFRRDGAPPFSPRSSVK